MLLFRVLVLFFFCSGFLYAQSLRIEKVIDNNLFVLPNGSLLKLAYVDAPPLNVPSLSLRKISKEAVQYAESVLLNRAFSFKLIKEEGGIYYGILYKTYLYDSTNVNSQFIRKGYAKVYPVDSSSECRRLLEDEAYAKKHSEGIWKLNEGLIPGSFMDLNESNNISGALPGEERARPTILTGLLEVGAGYLIGTLAGFSGAYIALILWNDKGMAALEPMILGFYTGYLFGSSAGVYAVGKSYNNDAFFLETLGYAFSAAVCCVGLSFAFPNTEELIALYIILPLAAEVYYINDINYGSKEAVPDEKILSHKDYYNKTNLFNCEILRINF